MMTSVKYITSYSNSSFFFFFFWNLLSYLVCMPSFKSINCSYLSRKWCANFIPTSYQLLQDQRMLVGIGLIELTEPSDTFNCMPFYKHCILQTTSYKFLLFILLWNKIFCSKNWAVFFCYYCYLYYFDLVQGGIQCYSIKGSVLLVLYYYKLIRNQGFISYSRYNLLEIAIKTALSKRPPIHIFNTM